MILDILAYLGVGWVLLILFLILYEIFPIVIGFMAYMSGVYFLFWSFSRVFGH